MKTSVSRAMITSQESASDQRSHLVSPVGQRETYNTCPAIAKRHAMGHAMVGKPQENSTVITKSSIRTKLCQIVHIEPNLPLSGHSPPKLTDRSGPDIFWDIPDKTIPFFP